MKRLSLTSILIIFTVFVLYSSMAVARESSFRIADINAIDLEDGEYYGSADDYDGAILKVKVLIKKHNIEDIEIIESKEDGYLYMASGLIPLIIDLQSVEIDAVSGATISSKALFAAIKDALSK